MTELADPVLERPPRERVVGTIELALRRRRYFSRQLEAMLAADPGLADPVLAAMTEYGIRPGHTNAELRSVASARSAVAFHQ